MGSRLPNGDHDLFLVQVWLWEVLWSFLWLHWWLRRSRICLQCRRPGFDPWDGKILWRGEWKPSLVFLPGEFHGQRSLMGYSPGGCKELNMTERLTLHFHFWSFFLSSHWAGRHWLWYEINLLSHVTIQLRNGSLWLCTIIKDDTSEWWFLVSPWGTQLNQASLPLQFASNAKPP